MPRALNVTAYYVRVDPSNWGRDSDIQQTRRTCEDIAQSVKRHVDDIGSVSVEYETESVCEFCGADWTEESATFNGCCCDEDMKHEPQEEDSNGQI